ncbi:DNA polymerase III subunit alpha [Periweissella cryptocerci]|uniref:DNA polymerase III subunit alpha n=1 Tax=Periweissella cryptocerci TaxID=2506420 RepID=A0A4P6YRB0_9LACO|nr:DNA polymerase III subunit alpha [Periweissella cryptocerci]QBO35146.1 DNA polymerase III subunit alpha [Periweissella cryptocerci]
MSEVYFDDDAYDEERTNIFIRDASDRGMLKWGGFYLSDHTKVIEQTQADEMAVEARQQHPQQSLSEIGQVLLQAQLKNKTVLLQRASQDQEHHIAADIIGNLNGYTDTGIVIAETQVAYDDIWYVELMG